MTTTTLRIEDILKSRAAEAAQRAGKTPHAFMLDAITEPVDQLELDNALANSVLADFDRFVEHLASFENSNASDRVSEIIQTIQILAHSPLVGRKVKNGKRELVISRGLRGYVALYRFVPQIETVFVFASHSQRELGFPAGR